jgi:DNA-binding MltR family transcriptional regulator
MGVSESFRARKAMMRTLARESDRGAILVSTAVVDECLAEVLSAWLAAATTKKTKSVRALLQSQGPLGSLWARAHMALAADLVDDWTFDAIEWLRKLRNQCAHQHGAISFADDAVAEMVKRMAECVDVGVPDDTPKRGGKARKLVLPNGRDLARRSVKSRKHAATVLTFIFAASALIGYLDAAVDAFRSDVPPANVPPPIV